ncbi:uncharacterized protein TRAVEDRAFT_48603 [Trametes versicolor FP-101664 SS1]|uniref:uncharacterized protein n=1 Tax=Trametes versicolor (strain FP-101664) TaxID=717944 RepID=UPI000462410D|nr:uncharacterized protein TRAVEDRAFT_48603 [Trametes versicolor FP-101664 SS1]EIW57564.1 hypothetical protein TRAVEDRAFT_48603 [Trametes versicolor FP-101664 SS1]
MKCIMREGLNCCDRCWYQHQSCSLVKAVKVAGDRALIQHVGYVDWYRANNFTYAAPPIAREVFKICHIRDTPHLILTWVIDLLTEELGFPPTNLLPPLPSSESATTTPEPIGSVAEEKEEEEEEDAEGNAPVTTQDRVVTGIVHPRAQRPPADSESSDNDYIDKELAPSADNKPLDADMVDVSFKAPIAQPAAHTPSVATAVPKAPQEAPALALPLLDTTKIAPNREGTLSQKYVTP